MRAIARVPRLLTAAVWATILWAAVPAVAQQATQPPAKKTTAAKPAKSKTPTPANPAAAAWTLQDALPSGRSAAEYKENPKERSPFDRIQLDTGTLGVETSPQFKDNKFSDGRPVPGLEADKRNAPSYFGLSLSVPTNDKSILPIPLLPRRE